jgi:thiamine biosynthesis lipoprotein
VLALAADCVASSGDYEQAFTRDLRHHHIIDPRTGRSPESTSGVTVVGPTAMDADAASTSAFVLGPGEGVAFLERLDRVEGMVVGKDQRQFRTRGFRHYLA